MSGYIKFVLHENVYKVSYGMIKFEVLGNEARYEVSLDQKLVEVIQKICDEKKWWRPKSKFLYPDGKQVGEADTGKGAGMEEGEVLIITCLPRHPDEPRRSSPRPIWSPRKRARKETPPKETPPPSP